MKIAKGNGELAAIAQRIEQARPKGKIGVQFFLAAQRSRTDRWETHFDIVRSYLV